MIDYDKLEISEISDLPDEIRERVEADAAEFARRHAEKGTKWLTECMALYKYQVEGAHQRLDEVHEALKHMARTILDMHDNTQEDTDDDGDWWKR